MQRRAALLRHVDAAVRRQLWTDVPGPPAAIPTGHSPPGPPCCRRQRGGEYRVRGIATDDEELDAFLFTLGCFAGAFLTARAG